MSEYLIRHLAQACAPRIAAHVESAVLETIKTHLPATIEAVLREQFPGETLRLYVAKNPGANRAQRDELIRMEYNGHNAQALATKYGVTTRTVFKAVSKHR